MWFVRGAMACGILLAACPVRATDCELPAGVAWNPERRAIERLTPALLFGWTFDRSASGYIGFEVSYTHQYRGTFGGYAQALLLSDPDAPSRRGQLAVGAMGGPWWAPLPEACPDELLLDARPLGRLGYAWRAGNSEVTDTSFLQAGVSANAIVGLIFTLGMPLPGGDRFHGWQPNLAIMLGAPLIVGQGY